MADVSDTASPPPLRVLSREALARVRDSTVAHYEQHAASFERGTADHDVSQNIEALLRHLDGEGAQTLLDLGCGPGRDLVTLRDRGHVAIGLDAAPAFVRRARAASGCEVWEQDLLALALPPEHFDGIFANAVLFHVPSQELARVLGDLHATLRPGGILFASNPRGPDIEELHGARYGTYLSRATWTAFVTAAGFDELEHYYRPPGRPRAEQPWLATVWRRR